ncbi:hypothetical protein [Actinomadura sp. K4S16]|uniref:hypothetical protein n=1 Tax=Actinomadura sp. K4S16 TaxID=1316147 RepID=UPI0011EDBD2F|nr:hypothetical protein [Actinomadura sp. K4S16]
MGTSQAKRAEVAARRNKAIQLRLAGVDWDTIAEQLGYRGGRGAACKDVARALQERRADLDKTAEELRAVEVARLDRLQAAAWGLAVQGEPASLNAVLRIIDRRIRLLGLDAPRRTEVTVQQIDSRDAELIEMINEARAGGEPGPGGG